MSKLVFCYWDLRGVGAPAVNMLEYSGMEYEHKFVKNMEEWLAEKFTLDLDFPNLPYLIDGDVRLTESWAIYKYIAKKVNLLPPSGEEYKRQSDMLEGVINDFRHVFANHCYKPEFYSLTDKLLETQRKKLNMMETYLQSRRYLVGDKLTYLDFALYETLDHHRLFFSDILSNYPSIDAYMKRFEAIDRINAYIKSDRYHQFPFLGTVATWSGKKYNDKK